MHSSPFKHLQKSSPPETSPRFSRNQQSSGVLPSFGGVNNKNSKGSLSTNDQSNPSPNITGLNQQERNQILKGMTPIEALEQYEGELTAFEMTELTTYPFIYTVGSVRIESYR